MKQPPKIYMIDRDRAMQIMWYIDMYYDEFKTVSYSDVKDKITEKEWMISQMYFNGNYNFDKFAEVMYNLQYNHPL
jgi:hypothetical protein